MSFCRFSSENYSCDIYAWESANGFRLEVATRRYVGNIPKVPLISSAPVDEWLRAHTEQSLYLRSAHTKRIGGKFDGKGFSFDTIEQLLEKILEVKAAGYNVPDWVIKNIEEEINEQGDKE